MNIRLSGIGMIFTGAAAAVGVAGIYVLGNTSFSDENGNPTKPFFGETAQETDSISREIGNIKYKFHDGLITEDYPDKKYMTFDFYIYDFNNEFVIADMIGASSPVKTFSEMADKDGNLPVHLDYVRGIGCDIVQEYYDRATTPQYGDVPADVALFAERHCDLEF